MTTDACETQPARTCCDDVARRVIDVVASFLVLLLLTPLLVVLAVLVKCSSPGPVLFGQIRVGENGRQFRLLKFRSMRIGGGGPSVTAGGDSRITSVGAFMRRLKLDELPQFWNVLVGEMSLVGPRPEVPQYVEHYTDRQREVLAARPGITGPTQLEYRNEEELLAGRDDVEKYYIEVVMPAKLEMDLAYIRERTVVSDLRVLLRTAAVVIGR